MHRSRVRRVRAAYRLFLLLGLHAAPGAKQTSHPPPKRVGRRRVFKSAKARARLLEVEPESLKIVTTNGGTRVDQLNAALKGQLAETATELSQIRDEISTQRLGLKTRYDYKIDSSPILSGAGRGPDYAGTDGVAGMWLAECPDCGAARDDLQLGLEDTPDEYVKRMVELFARIRLVMKPEGTVWLNIGDTYKDKQLLGVPWRVALALQLDGWLLRSDIIWHKPNPIPESCTDRPTKSHEHVFLLANQQRYFCDMEQIREPAKWERWGDQTSPKYEPMIDTAASKFKPRSKEYLQSLAERGRNSLDVWTLRTEPVADAHFAPMPETLAERCIKAGCPEGGLVLDPFGGAGTTGLVAAKLGRNAVLCELSREYATMARDRIVDEMPLAACVTLT
jgi:DNA modification methylase